MESKRRAGKTVLASSVFLGMAFGTAQAEICYKLSPFIDIFRLERLDALGADNHTLVFGNWIATGSYTLPIVGAYELAVGSTTVRRLGVHGVNCPGCGSGFIDCAFNGIPGGAWNFTCQQGSGSFSNSGSPLTSIGCPGQPISGPEATGPTAQHK